jgi:hypothetical protein
MFTMNKELYGRHKEFVEVDMRLEKLLHTGIREAIEETRKETRKETKIETRKETLAEVFSVLDSDTVVKVKQKLGLA